jgi:hypothetical protein
VKDNTKTRLVVTLTRRQKEMFEEAAHNIGNTVNRAAINMLMFLAGQRRDPARGTDEEFASWLLKQEQANTKERRWARAVLRKAAKAK